MKERPILFSASMVRALLAGTKTQTRRIMNPQPIPGITEIEELPATDPHLGCVTSGHSGIWEDAHSCDLRWRCPHGAPGDRLWVKETWATALDLNYQKPTDMRTTAPIYFRADGITAYERQPDGGLVGNWRPSLFMRRWMSRITLELTAVRVERLQDISEADALAEGITGFPYGAGEVAYGTERLARGVMASDPRVAYRRLWESINGPGSWDANPWVFVESFRRVTP